MNVSTTIYPYISINPLIAGGVPVISGTRVSVRSIAAYYQMGMSVDEILSSLSHLRPSQVHSALAYYFDHQEEVEKDLAESSDLEYWKSQAKVHPKAASLS